MKIDGGCHCGSIRYEAEIDPATVVVCHCSDCQTFSGSAFRVVVLTRPGSFTLLSGTPKVYVKTTAESGNPRQQTFCPECATPIYSAPGDGDTTVVVLRVGSIRQRATLVPQDQFWFRSSQPWLPRLATIARQDKQPTFERSAAPGER